MAGCFVLVNHAGSLVEHDELVPVLRTDGTEALLDAEIELVFV